MFNLFVDRNAIVDGRWFAAEDFHTSRDQFRTRPFGVFFTPSHRRSFDSISAITLVPDFGLVERPAVADDNYPPVNRIVRAPAFDGDADRGATRRRPVSVAGRPRPSTGALSARQRVGSPVNVESIARVARVGRR